MRIAANQNDITVATVEDFGFMVDKRKHARYISCEVEDTMDTLTINSRKLGRPVTFSQPGKNYVYVDLNGKPGTLGLQICEGGGFSGVTIMASSKSFERRCRSWFAAYLRAAESH